MFKKTLLLTLVFAGLNYQGQAQTLSDDIDISSGYYGVIPLPESAPAAFHSDNFVKYTKIQCPNGEAIHFVAQDDISDAQIIRARTLLEFYLKNVPGSEYGSDKTEVMNQMGTNEAILLLMNGSDGDGPEPEVFGQPLYKNEIAVEGSAWYQTNDFEHRDASFEEILHLMHDMGIGVDGIGGMPGALPDYQLLIRTAQENAALDDFAIWPLGAGSDPDISGWYSELAAENSLTQEYLASIIDSYYGLWEPWEEDPTTGMWGIYIAHNRAEIETEDPMGWALLPQYFSPYINVDMIIDPSFDGVFSLTNDPANPYTHKSQYLQHCYLTGSNNSGFKGNHLYNRLRGNSGNNSFEGMKGNDRLDGNGGENTAIFTGAYDEYTVTNFDTYAIVADEVEDRDGVDTLWNIQKMVFEDQTVDLTLESTVVSIIPQEKPAPEVRLYPNPGNGLFNLSVHDYEGEEINITVYNNLGSLVYSGKLINVEQEQVNLTQLSKGIYVAHIASENLSVTKRIIIQ